MRTAARAHLCVIAIAIGGCSLVLDADKHVGTGPRDASQPPDATMDAPRSDASDAGTQDADLADTNLADAGETDSGPTSCGSSTECRGATFCLDDACAPCDGDADGHANDRATTLGECPGMPKDDCDDADPRRFPSAPELCGDGLINGCVSDVVQAQLATEGLGDLETLDLQEIATFAPDESVTQLAFVALSAPAGPAPAGGLVVARYEHPPGSVATARAYTFAIPHTSGGTQVDLESEAWTGEPALAPAVVMVERASADGTQARIGTSATSRWTKSGGSIVFRHGLYISAPLGSGTIPGPLAYAHPFVGAAGRARSAAFVDGAAGGIQIAEGPGSLLLQGGTVDRRTVDEAPAPISEAEVTPILGTSGPHAAFAARATATGITDQLGVVRLVTPAGASTGTIEVHLVPFVADLASRSLAWEQTNLGAGPPRYVALARGATDWQGMRVECSGLTGCVRVDEIRTVALPSPTGSPFATDEARGGVAVATLSSAEAERGELVLLSLVGGELSVVTDTPIRIGELPARPPGSSAPTALQLSVFRERATPTSRAYVAFVALTGADMAGHTRLVTGGIRACL